MSDELNFTSEPINIADALIRTGKVILLTVEDYDALRASRDIAIEGLEEIYNTHEHIHNKYAQGAAKIASKTLGRLK